MTNNTPVAKVYFNLRFAVKRGPEAWVKSVRFADGPGMKVKSVSFTANRSEAAPFSRVHAHAVAEQFYNRIIAVYTTDGRLHEEATSELAKANDEKRRKNAEAVRQFNEDMRAFWADALANVPALRETLEGLARIR